MNIVLCILKAWRVRIMRHSDIVRLERGTVMNATILVVDDEQEIADLIEVYLKNEGFTVYKYYNGSDAWQCISETKLDLAILDVMMPGMDGFALLRKIREKHTFPVIMLTAREEEIDKITGLTLGADDYITKPFRPLEMVARVKAQLRRFRLYNQSSEAEEEEQVIAFSGLVLNKDTHECTLNERQISLTPTEFSILWCLCENRGHVVSSEKLFYEVWGEKYFSSSNNTVMVHIRHLREKMKDSAEHPKYIKTVWGVGYKIG
jgi:two-component system response regulator VanR